MSPTTSAVYIIAPKQEAPRARRAAAELREAGVPVASTWHDTYKDGEPDPTHPPTAVSILATNLADLGRADLALALTCDDAGRETYVELGRALDRKLPVVWSGERGGLALSWWDGHAIAAATDAEAIQSVLRLTAFA